MQNRSRKGNCSRPGESYFPGDPGGGPATSVLHGDALQDIAAKTGMDTDN
jgi:hypothetical protein